MRAEPGGELAAEEALLLGAHHPQRPVVEEQDLDRELLRCGGNELLHVHQQ